MSVVECNTMSGYGSMQASPFWKCVMRITGILCFVTLIIPPAYYFKYLIFDSGREAAVARTPIADVRALPVTFRYTEFFRHRALTSPEPSDRIQAVQWLARLVLSPLAQVTHPIECMYAKVTLEGVAAHDKNATVRSASSDALYTVASHGVVISR